MSKIEQIIAEIEEFIDGCKYQTLSNTKIIVNRDELEELLADLKHCIPDEIKKYQRIIANRDAILKDAQDKSDEMVRKANEMTSTLVSEHEIMQQAFKEANAVIDDATQKAGKILDKATTEANEVRRAAMKYTDDSLANIQEILSSSIEGMTVKYDALIRSLESSLDITTQNRKALHNTPAPEPVQPAPVIQEEPQYYEDEAYDDFEGFDEGYEIYEDEEDNTPYEEPIYGKHNPAKMTIEDALYKGNVDASEFTQPPSNDVEEITDFNLDISDFN